MVKLSLTVLALLLGLIVGALVTARIRLAEHSSEYVTLVAKKHWKLVAIALLAQSIAAVTLLIISDFWLKFLFDGDDGLTADSPHLAVSLIVAAAAGLMAGFLPLIIESSLVSSLSERILRNKIFAFLLTTGIFILQEFEFRIQREMENDNFAWQLGEDDWRFGVEPAVVRRRIRKLYELCKCEIANDRKDPRLLFSDVNHHPGRKFYALVKFMGPRKLRQRLGQDVNPPSPAWDGNERRRNPVRGVEPGTSQLCRCYDDPAFLDDILHGRASCPYSPEAEFGGH